jgi:hypothetical protein
VCTIEEASVSSVSISQIKNLQRRLNLLEQEAISEVNRACGHELWQSLGFDALDAIEDAERRARANFYFGQLQTARQLIDVLG